MKPPADSDNALPPPEIAHFLETVGMRPLTAEEARALNLLYLKHGLPAASATGIAERLAASGWKGEGGNEKP